MKNKGFTLVEMLVVVLIIGVLAGIAFPQYEKAVIKSKAANLLPTAKAYAEYVENYYLVHGKYPVDATDDLLELFPGFTKSNDSIISNGNIKIITTKILVGLDVKKDTQALYIEYIGQKEVGVNPSRFRGHFLCYAASNNKVGEKVCQNITGDKTPSYYLVYRGRTSSGVNWYSF